jgi:hypothetical protein
MNKLFLVEFFPIYNDSKRIRISGSDIGSDKFELANFHFHWGKNFKDGNLVSFRA